MRTIGSRLTGLVIVLGALWGCGGEGDAGADALVSLKEEPAGKNCPMAGTRIEAGRDTNHDDLLDSSEIESTAYSCNGAAGEDGPAGSSEPGEAGADGHAALIVTSAEAEGDDCPAGGQRIDQGVDVNDDGVLDSDEIASTAKVCSGAAGDSGEDGRSSLIDVTAEAAGANCATGGQRVESGIDADADGDLAASEIDETEYFCNGIDGETALDSVSKVTTEAAGAHCADGGLRIDIGLDDDDDHALDDGEIDVTNYACNGAKGAGGADGAAGSNGKTSLVLVVDEAAGGNCTNGGEKITYGLDGDGSGTLGASEVAGTRYVCDGAPGADGVTSLVKVTPIMAGAVCTYGGQSIDSGRDDDESGVLDAGEIENTTHVCNGEP